MMDDMIFSFIVPAKNEEDNILKCITSIMNDKSSTGLYEIIIVDNGSSDRTVEICNSLNAKVIENDSLNISGLRNLGAKCAKGKYLCFIDADMVILEGWKKQVEEILSNVDIGIVGSSPCIPPQSSWVTRVWNMQKQSRRGIGERPWLPSMNMAIRREIFFRFNGFKEELITGEDVDFCIRVSNQFKIIDNEYMKAIHYGEPKSLMHLFKKEFWRGTNNITGLVYHGFSFKEMPSIMFPIINISVFFGNAIYFLFSYKYYYLNCILFVYPLLKTFSIIIKTKKVDKFFGLFLVWSVYTLARSVSMLKELINLTRRKPVVL